MRTLKPSTMANRSRLTKAELVKELESTKKLLSAALAKADR